MELAEIACGSVQRGGIFFTVHAKVDTIVTMEGDSEFIDTYTR